MLNTYVVVGFALALVLNLLLSAGILWLSARWSRIAAVSYRRALATVATVAVLGLLLLLVVEGTFGRLTALNSLLYLAAALTLNVIGVKLFLRTTLPRALLATVIWLGIGVVYSVGFVYVVKEHVAEAFVVPTGGMAETIWGYHKTVVCPQCGHTFPINASMEGDPSPQRPPMLVTGCTCPNCRFGIDFLRDGSPALTRGDRILTLKAGHGPLQRFQVVVFDFPNKPAEMVGPLRYVKRLIGLPGETIGIHAGKVYVSDRLALPATDGLTPNEVRQSVGRGIDGNQTGDASEAQLTRRREYQEQLSRALAQAEKQLASDVRRPTNHPERRFTIVRKPPEVLLALSRLVYDSDHQAADLADAKVPPRWQAAAPWQADDANRPRVFTHPAGGEMTWLRYRHLVPDDERKSAHAQLITDFSGYNTARPNPPPAPNWVGDLMLEADVQVDSSDGEIRLEVAKGIDRFQARFNLQSGDCTLVRLQGAHHNTLETILDTKATPLKGTGTFHVRFANVDERLTLWVNDVLPFGDGKEYEPAPLAGPTEGNDINGPASIGVKAAAVTVTHLKLWRDNYYTSLGVSGDVNLEASLLSDPDSKDGWRSPEENTSCYTTFVHAGHYFVLGDNSPESSDSRYWGLVPESFMQGPVPLRYFPFSRYGPVH